MGVLLRAGVLTGDTDREPPSRVNPLPTPAVPRTPFAPGTGTGAGVAATFPGLSGNACTLCCADRDGTVVTTGGGRCTDDEKGAALAAGRGAGLRGVWACCRPWSRICRAFKDFAADVVKSRFRPDLDTHLVWPWAPQPGVDAGCEWDEEPGAERRVVADMGRGRRRLGVGPVADRTEDAEPDGFLPVVLGTGAEQHAQ